jgi:hypothetical protein
MHPFGLNHDSNVNSYFIAARKPAIERLPRPIGLARLLWNGSLAQWLEPTAHNGLVVGSSPTRPTSLRSARYGSAGQRPVETETQREGCRGEARRAKLGFAGRRLII